MKTVNKMKNWLSYNSDNIITAVGAVVILVVIFGGAILSAEREKSVKEKWNDGVCESCEEGEYQFVGVAHIKNYGDKYFWACDECGHVIETRSLMR